MKTKHALIVLILGFVLIFIGSLLKVMHWPYASEFLIAGTFFQVGGALMFLGKLLTYPKFRDFLNW